VLGRRDDVAVAGREHDLVADALLGRDEDGLAGERRPVPARKRHDAHGVVFDERVGVHSPFILAPAGGEVAFEQQQPRDLRVRFTVRRVTPEDFREMLPRLVDPAEIAEQRAEILIRDGGGRVER
jgi:hypothetical protein